MYPRRLSSSIPPLPTTSSTRLGNPVAGNTLSCIRHDDNRPPIKIPRRDWLRLPSDQRAALDGRLYVLSGARTRRTFVRAILL